MTENRTAPRVAGLSDRIREAREQAGISSDELADRIGWHRKTVERWQRSDDHASVPAAAVVRIAATCEVDPTWLLVGEHTQVAS